MRILLLCEGDAETRDSWSGVSNSVVRYLRGLGHTVVPADVDLYGHRRLLTGLRTFSPARRRWWVRYHLSAPAFHARSKEARRRLEAFEGELDVILQVGATFQVSPPEGVPLVLYCDSNIEMARQGAKDGLSEASVLTAEEIAEIRSREEGVYESAELIFTMSERLRRSFIQDFGLPPAKLTTVHCGPNTKVESRPRLEGGPPTVLFVGRDFERKGGDVLLAAFRRVRGRIPDARLVMIGSRQPGVDEAGVEIHGFQSRDSPGGRDTLDAAYRAATLFCLPTRFEPFGTSFVEAMMYGLPCVGPDAWAVPEIIVHGETGLLVPPEDPDALSDALVALLSDRPSAREMGERGRARVLEHFTWDRVVGRIAEGLESVVERRMAS